MKRLLLAPVVGAALVVAALGAGSAQARYAPGIANLLDASSVTTPPCTANIGNDVDEEICMFVTNQLLAWSSKPPKVTGAQAASYARTGPLLTGNKSLIWMPYGGGRGVLGGWKDGFGVYYAGPACPGAKAPGETFPLNHNDYGLSESNPGPRNGANKCVGTHQGWGFGARRQVQFWDDNASANSGLWNLDARAGDVPLGMGTFRATNNGGAPWGNDVPTCDKNKGLGWWISCAPSGQVGNDGEVNSAGAADGISASRLSAGFYVHDFPVAVKVTNQIKGSVFEVTGVTESNVKTSARASTLHGPSIDGGAGATISVGSGVDSLWWAGLRRRDGGTIEISGVLTATDPSASEAWNGASVVITVPFSATSKAAEATCQLTMTNQAGSSAQCVRTTYQAGGVRNPGVAEFRIFQ